MITEMELEQFKKLAAAARGEKAEPEEAQALTEPEEKPEEASFVARPSLSGENKPLFSSLSFVESRKAEIEDEIAEERSAFLEPEPLKEAPVGTFRRTASETAGNIWDAFTASSEADARAEAWEERAEAEEMFGEAGTEARDALADAEKAAKEKEIAFFVSPFRAPARAFMEAHADTQDEYSKTAQGIRRTATAMTYFLTPEERLAKAEEVSRFTGIPAEAILSDEETWKRALFLYDYAKRKQAVADREGEDFSLEDVYAEFPKLKEIAGMSPAKAALALHDLKHIRAARDTFEAFGKAYERGQEYNEYGELLYKLGQYGEHQLTDKEKARLAVLREKMTEEPIQATFFEDPLLALAEGAGENLPLMVESFKEGEALALTYMQAGGAMGAAVGAAGLGIGAAPGAAAGTGAGAALGFLQGTARTFARYMLRRGAVSAARTLGQYNAMRRQSTGTTYEDYRQMRDADGNPLMTDREAWKEAQAPGAVNAAIELVEFKTLLGNVKGEYSKKLVAEIFRNGQKMMSGASAKKAAAGAAGGVLKGTEAEVAEEAEQSVSDDFFHNRVMDKYNGGEGKYTAGEMAERAFLSAAEAVPAALALGMGSTLGGAPASAWRFRSQSALWNQSLGSYKEKQRETLAGVSVLENLEQAAQDTKLKETAPEVLAEMVRAEAKGTPFETVYVDLEVLQEQGSTEDLEKLAKTAGFADVQEMMENGVSVSMPVELYAQAEMSPEAKEAASFSPEADSIAVMRKKAEEVNAEAKRRMDAEIQKQIDLAEGAVAALFPEEGAVRDAAMASLYMNPENPAEGWKAAYAQAIAQRDEMLAPALEALERGMGQGTSVVETVNENGDVQTGRVSNNDVWYQEWFKEHGKAPTKGELRELARLMITGDASAPTVSGWSEWTNNKEAAEELAKNEPVLARLEQEIEALEAAKERMRTLSGAEMGVIGGMTPEAFRVYRETAAKLREGGMDNKEARMSAALFARHADIMAARMRKRGNEKYTAARMRKRGNEKYTAADYAKTVLFLQGQIARDADASMKGLKFAQAEMNRQKEEVRKQYEGTDQWMKAPNGEPTNLTEEQWLTVRTDAFKNWFGDWEVAIAAQEILSMPAKALTMSGKPLDKKDVEERFVSFGEVENKRYGVKATFPVNTAGKVVRHKGFDVTQISEALPRLFESSVLAKSEPEEIMPGHKKHNNIALYHHFVNKFSVAGKEYYIRFTATEEKRKRPTNERTVHSTAISEVEIYQDNKKDASAVRLRVIDPGVAEQAPFFDTKLAQILDSVNTASKVVDENGEPLVVYHGSPSTFEVFDKSRMGENRGYLSDLGFYFSNDKAHAKEYIDGKNDDVYNVFLNLKNPLIVEDEGWGSAVGQTDVRHGELKRWAEEGGNDGIIVKSTDYILVDDAGKEYSDGVYVAFEPTQIKSATDNNGQFAVDDPNIYHQFAGENAETADKVKLAEAQRMEKSGASAEDIFKATGWLKGEDGEWRFEIPDDLDKINLDLLRIREHLPLGELYANEDLYEAYPFLRDVIVSEEDMAEGSVGRLDVVNNIIFLNADMLAAGEGKLKESIVHEIQHIIQFHEGFAMGGNPADVRGQILSEIRRIKGDVDQNKDAQEKYIAYQEKTLEALNDPTPEKWEEMQLAAEAFEKTVEPKNKKRFERLMSRMESLQKEYDSGVDNYFLYARLGGEQEARKTADRAEAWTKKQRDVEKASRALNEGMEKATKEQRAALVERMKLAFEIEGTPTDQQIALMEKYESEMGEELSSLYDDYMWGHGELEEFAKDMPRPHNKAIIVFGGKEMPYSQKQEESLAGENEAAKKNEVKEIPIGLSLPQRNYLLGKLNASLDRVIEEMRNSGLSDEEIAAQFNDQNSKMREDVLKWVHETTSLFTSKKANKRDFVLEHTRGLNIDTSAEGIEKAYKALVENARRLEDYASTIYRETAYFNRRGSDGLRNRFGSWDELRRAQEGHGGNIGQKDEVNTAQANESRSENQGGFSDGQNQETYSQQANGGSKNQGGTARLPDGQRIVMLFENADKSTFVHEMGHVFLMDLEELAELGDEDARRDLDLIDDWASWKGKGDAKKFAGSAWADEFRKREQAIIDAERAGNLLERDKLLVKWRHERFARAFELYLKEGKAPSEGLREVFRKFADWLRKLYYAFLSSGARASAQVEAVMGRMLATEEEIRWAEMDARYEDFTKAGGEQLLKEDAKTTISRWQEESKAEAKERIMRRLMRDHTKAEKARREEILESRRAEKEKELQNQPVYLARNAIELTGDQTMWRTYFKTEAEWKAADRKALPMDAALADFVKEERRKMDKEDVKRTLTKEEIEEALSSSAYHVKLVQAEQQIFAEKMALIKKIGEKTQSAAGRVEDAVRRLADGTDLKADGKTPEVEELMKALGALKVSAKWDAKAGEAIERMGRAKTKEEIEKAFERFRKEHMERKLGLADLKKANEGEVQTIRRLAKLDMENMPIAKATAVNMWRNAERAHARRAEQMARAGRWDVAASEKKSELRASFHAEEARKIRDRVDKILRHVKEQAKSKAKMPKDERYWHQHIAYLLRLVPDDAERPEGLKSLDALAKEMTDGLDVIGDENGNSELTALLLSLVDGAKKKETQEGYLGMTIGELADAADALTALYTVGRDKFKMKTFKGKTIRQCCDEMIEDEGQAGGFLVKRNVLTGAQDTGGVFWNELLAKVPGFGTALAEKTQRYALSLTKPEELIKLLGPKAHRYLYMTYDDAASREAVMTADAAARVETLLSVYTDEERRAWQDKAYSWIGVLNPSRKGELDATKEHILAMALNMGNDVNMDRLMQGLAPEGTTATESQVQMFVQAHMTEKDWKFVQGMWNLLHEYWPETVRVEMELNGTKLAPQEARPFTVETTGEDGRRKKLDLAGGYYPIAYDHKKSAKAGEQELNAEAEKGMYGAAVFGMGRSFTKGRAGLGKIQGRPLNLSLSVAQKHIGAVIHNITYRVAARDVYRMVNDKAFRQHVESTLGAEAYRVIRDWAMDNWKTPPMAQDMAGDFWNGALSHIRRHAGIAIMGYRLWPAVENATNIAPMMDYLGAAEAISAMQDYWGHKAEFDELLLKSVFMRQRAEHMDRDMRTKEDLFAADRKVPKWLREHAYWLMEKTDLATSAPLWCRVYKNSFSGKLAEVRRENEENKKALSAAQMKRDAVAAEIYDLKKREQAIEKEIENRAYVRLPEAESEFAGQGKSELRAELGGLREKLKEKRKELFIANNELDLAAELVIRTDAEILREAEHRAVQEADGAVRNVFGSGDVKDLSPVQKSKSEFIKALTMFYSYFNAQANAIMAANWQGKAAGASGMERWAPLARAMAYRFLLTSVIGTALRMMLLREGDDDKDKYERDKKGNYLKDANGKRIEIPAYRRVLKQLAKNTLSTGVGTLYGVREAGNYLINRAFDGTDYGRSVRTDGMMGRFTDQTIRTASLFAAKWERDEKQKEKEAEEKEKYRRMTPKQRKRYDEEKKYRKPPNTISYADLLRSVGGLAVSVTAAQTGVTEPIANAVLGTMQYLTDSDGRYEASLNNILWSALWTKKPVRRTPPEKTETPEERKRRERKERRQNK